MLDQQVEHRPAAFVVQCDGTRVERLSLDEQAIFAWVPTLTAVSRQAVFSYDPAMEFADLSSRNTYPLARRTFMTVITGGLLAVPFAAQTQPMARAVSSGFRPGGGRSAPGVAAKRSGLSRSQ